jgi:hypothetical protein
MYANNESAMLAPLLPLAQSAAYLAAATGNGQRAASLDEAQLLP